MTKAKLARQERNELIKGLKKRGLTHKEIAEIAKCGVATVHRAIHDVTRARPKNLSKKQDVKVVKNTSRPKDKPIKTMEFSIAWGMFKLVKTMAE